MTTGERLFFFILAFRFLVANPVSLDFPLIPKINGYDLNNNGISDFIAFGNSGLPRTLYHVESSSSGTEILFEYSMPEDKNGYFTDMILGDFDYDGTIELIASAYQDESSEIFYIFSADAMGVYSDSPLITGLNNTRTVINNPGKLYPMQADANQQSMFLLSLGSPNRRVIICEYLDGEIIARGSVGKEFLINTLAPIEIALGDFNGDGGEDIFLLNNGLNPKGYFIFSDGLEEDLNLASYPRLKFLHKKGVDLNFDGSDDLVMVNRNGELMSDIWGVETIQLSDKKIQNILINPDNGFVYLTSISQSGKIGNFSIDPLTRTILSSDFELPEFAETDYKNVYSLAASQEILLIHDGVNPELWSIPLATELITDTPPPILIQRIYYREPNYVINLGEDFSHLIEWESTASFRNFTEEYIPSGMEFNLDSLKLDWTPKPEQLGYHELSYKLELREKGSRELDTDNGKIFVSQKEPLSEKPFSYLMYVNDPISLRPETDSITIVNGELFEWIIPIDDKNADARLSVEKISGSKNAEFSLLQPEIILVPIDTVIIPIDLVIVDSVVVDTAAVEPEVVVDTLAIEPEEPAYVDTVQTEFEKFAEEKLEAEKDPFKKKKQESSVEEFKTKEEEYREKLKTHKKILRDGKNIWVPKDSLAVPGDSTIIEEPEIVVADSLESSPPDFLQISEEIADTIAVSETIEDTRIISEEVEEALVDTHYLEISYAELINHQAQFSWEPQAEPGDYDFALTATDGFTVDTTTFTLTVHPEIDLSMNQTRFTATVDKIFITDISLQQSPLSEQIEYHLIHAPENMRIDTIGAVSWIPLPTQVDDYNFEIEVTDGIASTLLQYSIYVNAPPVISSRPPEIFILPEGEKLDFSLESFDLNSNTELNWKLLSGPMGMTLNQQGSLNWGGGDLGHHPYEIQLSDGIDSVHWQASIYVNTPPVFTSTPIMVVPKGERYEYQLSAQDENIINPFDSLGGNEIIFSLAQGPDSMIIDENNILVWETEDNPPGEYMTAVTASDGVDDAIQVFPVFINSFPVITSLDSITVKIGDTLNFQFEADDPNLSDTLSFHLDPLNPGMKLNTFSGVLNWIPAEEDLGLHSFSLEVKDGHGIKGISIPFQVYAYRPPRLTSELLSEAFSGLEYAVFLTAENMYGQKLSRPDAIKIDSATFSYYHLSEYAHQFKWTPREIDKGDHELVILITDDYGFTTYHAHKLSVFTNPCVHCNNEDEEVPADSTGN